MKESPTTVTKKQGWGGKRAGSGRKPGHDPFDDGSDRKIA